MGRLGRARDGGGARVFTAGPGMSCREVRWHGVARGASADLGTWGAPGVVGSLGCRRATGHNI